MGYFLFIASRLVLIVASLRFKPENEEENAILRNYAGLEQDQEIKKIITAAK